MTAVFQVCALGYVMGSVDSSRVANQGSIGKQSWEDTNQHLIKKFFTAAFIGGGLAGFSHFFVLPIDVIKCRIQVGECTSLRQGLYFIFTEESFHSSRIALGILFKGWLAALIGYGAQSSVKFLFYEYFKSFWIPLSVSINGTSLDAMHISKAKKMMVYLISGALAEVLADVLLIPWETTKVHMQTLKASSTAPSTIEHANAMSFSTLSSIQKVYQTQGIYSFYRGLVPLWMRQIPYTAAKFFFFELCVNGCTSLFLYQTSNADVTATTQLIISLISGSIAGALAALVSHPADTMLSKLAHQREQRKIDPNNSNKLSLTAGGKTTRAQLFELWNGVTLRMIMAAILTSIQWVLYDSVKVYCGFVATGSAPRK